MALSSAQIKVFHMGYSEKGVMKARVKEKEPVKEKAKVSQKE